MTMFVPDIFLKKIIEEHEKCVKDILRYASDKFSQRPVMRSFFKGSDALCSLQQKPKYQMAKSIHHYSCVIFTHH